MRKVKAPAETTASARDATEADAFVARIGDLTRRLQDAQTAHNDAVAALSESLGEAVRPAQEEIVRLTRGVQIWAEAHRAALTRDGAVKTVRLTAGEIGWRQRPPAVRVRNAAALIEHLLGQQMLRFVRVKHELDKEAMLREPAAATLLPGVTIGSAGEEFVIAPNEFAIAPVQSPVASRQSSDVEA